MTPAEFWRNIAPMKRLTAYTILCAALLLAGLAPAGRSLAQGPDATATPDLRPTLPPTWTLTPTRPPTQTPRPIPTQPPTPIPSPTPTLSWLPTVQPPPPAVTLPGMTLIWQQYNGCAAAALTMLLKYHGWQGTLDMTSRGIKPDDADVSVRGIEMVSFVEAQGLRAVVRSGGTLEILRGLVAAGLPVLVENAYNPGGNDWMGHNRVIMGYDDRAGVVLTFDSVLGAGSEGTGRPIPYAEFEALWKPFNHTYLVIFRPDQERTVQAILGPHWNATTSAELALARAEAAIRQDPQDAYAAFNLGTALLTLGWAETAVLAFERALDLGLPWRYLWYQFGPFEAYLQTGRYEQVLALGEDVLRTTRNVEEVYYFMGQAYAALGQPRRAAANYQQALAHNRHFVEAELALERLASAVAMQQ
ncbi:MAG: hypothetical protein Kow0077_23200 [Anaerolineae bacterium]